VTNEQLSRGSLQRSADLVATANTSAAAAHDVEMRLQRMVDQVSVVAAPAREKWLTLSASDASWRLPDDANLDHLEALIKAAMRSSDPLTVEVQGETPAHRMCLLLNGSALPFAVLSERPRDA
jgi:hypothetical protein